VEREAKGEGEERRKRRGAKKDREKGRKEERNRFPRKGREREEGRKEERKRQRKGERKAARAERPLMQQLKLKRAWWSGPKTHEAETSAPAAAPVAQEGEAPV